MLLPSVPPLHGYKITMIDLSVIVEITIKVICSFYRASICEGSLGSRNSVRPSVS